MHFLFLCDQLAGYWHYCICQLADRVPGGTVTVVARPGSAHVPFVFPEHPGVVILDRSEVDWPAMQRLLVDRPDFVYISGWRDPCYRRIGRMMRSTAPVVMGSDNLWYGSPRQYLAVIGLQSALRGFCNHMWVPGLYQYEYARRLGFDRERILTGLYTASGDLYDSLARDRASIPRTERIVFVGSLIESKGVRELVAAFRGLEDRFPTWTLRLVGDGPLRAELEGMSSRIEVTGFIQPSQLPAMFRDAGAFCLPSHKDHWAVVIHEACCAALPVVATTACGAVSTLVYDGYNGFRCAPRSVPALQAALEGVMQLDPATALEYGRRSRELSYQFTPDLWVTKVLSTLPADRRPADSGSASL